MISFLTQTEIAPSQFDPEGCGGGKEMELRHRFLRPNFALCQKTLCGTSGPAGIQTCSLLSKMHFHQAEYFPKHCPGKLCSFLHSVCVSPYPGFRAEFARNRISMILITFLLLPRVQWRRGKAFARLFKLKNLEYKSENFFGKEKRKDVERLTGFL